MCGRKMAVGVELAQDVAENLRQGQTAVADMTYFALQGMEVLIVDPYFDTKNLFHKYRI